MYYASRYKLKETDTFLRLGFHRVNQYRVRSIEIERGGRFFRIENGAFEPPEISMN
jgi:hypothetical protein